MVIRVTLLIAIVFCGLLAQGQSISKLRNNLNSLKGKEKIELLGELSYQYAFIKIDSAIYFGKLSEKLAIEYGDSKLISDAKNNLSFGYYFQGNHAVSNRLNAEALVIRVKLGDSLGVVSSLSKLGNSHYELGLYQEALQFNLRALKIAEDSNQVGLIYKINNNLGNIYDKTFDVEAAKKCYERTMEMAVEFKDTTAMLIVSGNLSNTYMDIKNYPKALEYANFSVELANKIKDVNYLAQSYQTQGAAYRALGNHRLGINSYLKSLLYYQQTRVDGYSSVAVNLSNAYGALNQLDSAKYYLRMGLKVAREHESAPRLNHVYDGYRIFFENSNQLDSAYHYSKLMLDFNDTIHSENAMEKIAEMKVKFDTERKEKALIEERLTTAENELKIKQGNLRTTIISGLAILILLSSVLVVKMQRNKRQKLAIVNAFNLEKEKAIAEKKIVDEKQRISRELHDNIGSQLTFMISSIENASFRLEDSEKSKFSKITSFGRDAMNDLRNTVWAIKQKNGTVKELATKFLDLKQGLASEIEISIEFEPTERESLNANQMLNFYRIGQEFVHNTVKYANASKIEIVFTKASNECFLSFKDNGCGFDTTKSSQGNGLRNMNKRATDASARFKLTSSESMGTKAEIYWNTQHYV